MDAGSLAVFSPVALTPEVKTKLQEMGNDLKYMIAPDLEHHIYLGDWAEAFPGAKIVGPEGLKEKRAKDSSMKPLPIIEYPSAQKSTFRIDSTFDGEFEHEFVDVHPNKELVFFHKPSKTLIEADLLFNLPATEQYSRAGGGADSGIMTRIFGAMQHTRGEAMAQRRFLWNLASRADRPRFNDSMQRINSWDFTRIIPCHGESSRGRSHYVRLTEIGDVIEQDAKGIFAKVFQWHLGSK